MKQKRIKLISKLMLIMILLSNLIIYINPNLYFKLKTKINTIINTKEIVNFYYEPCEYIRTIDGDTIIVKINEKEETVRLVEINTPESVHPDKDKNNTAGEKASEYTKNILDNYKILYLSKDITNKDKYGRLLRIVWLNEPLNDSEEELKNKSLNAKLLLNGYAKVVMYDDYKYHKIFKKFEKESKKNNK